MGPGTRIGHYRVLRKLGAGAMGAIYQVEHTLIGRSAAIKTLLPALSEQRDAVARFFTEARATSVIRDPGIVQLFDFGFHVDGTAYIVMELLEGESLAERLDRLGRLPVEEALRIIVQAASALSAAHDRGIVHRDLKPDNIMIVPDAAAQGGERPKIFDFGIAMLETEVSPRQTANGTMLGTPLYMPPEQARGGENVDARADVYSLGCVLFHMLTGRPPFDAENSVDIIMAHLLEPAPAPSQVVPEIPACVDDLVLRCMAKDPDDRIASMSELRVECSAALAQLSRRAISHDDTLAGTPEPALTVRAPTRIPVSIAVVIALLVGATVTSEVAVELTHDRSAAAASFAPIEATLAPAPVPAPPPPVAVVAEPEPEPEPEPVIAPAPAKVSPPRRVVKAKKSRPRKPPVVAAPRPAPSKDPYARR